MSELTIEKIDEARLIDGPFYLVPAGDGTADEVHCDVIINFLIAALANKEIVTAEKCVDLIKSNMSDRLNVNRSWTSFAEEAIRDHFNLKDC